MDRQKAKESLEEAARDFYYIHQHSEDAHTDSYKFMGKVEQALVNLGSEPKCILCNYTGYKPPYRFGGVAIPCACGGSGKVKKHISLQKPYMATISCPDCQKSEPSDGYPDYLRRCAKFMKEHNIDEILKRNAYELEKSADFIHHQAAIIKSQAEEIKDLKT